MELITSIVVVGDFAAQAVVNTILSRTFPNDPIVGEEDASDLRTDTGVSLRERVIALANESLTASLQPGESESWGLGPTHQRTTEELLAAIDRGNHEGGRTGRASRFLPFFVSFPTNGAPTLTGMWTLDPIDGTKGFLRGEQYAVCLALIVDARVELGIIGCPNLPADPAQPDGVRGVLFVATCGHGALQLPLHAGEEIQSGDQAARLQIPRFAPEQLNLLESVEKAHAKLSFNAQVARLLSVTRRPTRMDSQAKYGALARGDGGVYLRMPVGSGYRDKIWVRLSRVVPPVSADIGLAGSCTRLFACRGGGRSGH